MPRHDPSRRIWPTDASGRWSHERLIAWAAVMNQRSEFARFYDVDLKASLSIYLNKDHMRKVYQTLEKLYPDEHRIFVLVYPLDEETNIPNTSEALPVETLTLTERAKMQQETIGTQLHWSQSAVSRRLERGRFHFSVLYEGRVLPPRRERKTLDKAK